MPRITRTNFHDLRLALLAEEPGSISPGVILSGICPPPPQPLRALTSTPTAEAQPLTPHVCAAEPKLIRDVKPHPIYTIQSAA